MKFMIKILLAALSLSFPSYSLVKEKVEIVTGNSHNEEINYPAKLLQNYLTRMYQRNRFAIVEEPSGNKAIFLTLPDRAPTWQILKEMKLPEREEGYAIKGQESEDQS